jgi:photosystem II stability/assembly factor-like uncharacterized protein
VGSLPAEQPATSILVDSQDPQRMYAGGPSGIYRSSDAGQTWELAQNNLNGATVASLALDRENPDRLFAVLSNGSLLESLDGAITWRALDR